jgi:hypothetical protein
MTKLVFAIQILIAALLVFAVLRAADMVIPLGSLLVFLSLLNIGVVWMVITILKNGEQSSHTFRKRYDDDAGR